jgi:hypothetical protein
LFFSASRARTGCETSSQAELLNDGSGVSAALQGSPGVTLHCVDAFVLELLCHPARLFHNQDS